MTKNIKKILKVIEIVVAIICYFVFVKQDDVYVLSDSNDMGKDKEQRICSDRIKIIDGDTVELAGQRFRLACVDTPESKYKGKSQYCLDDETDCGKLAQEALEMIIHKNLKESGKICCGWIKKDKYDRYLAWCDNGIDEMIPFYETINYNLISGGYAWFYDGGKECDMFVEPFVDALKNKRGLFNESVGGFKEPKEWRKENE